MVQLQARGEGLCPVNTECMTDSMVAFLQREGYTDIRAVPDKPKKVTSAAQGNDTPARRAPTKRTVVRRPRT